MALKGVVRGQKRPPRIIVYGPPKIGKSSFIASTEKPIVVQTADAGIDNLPVDALPVCRSWTEALNNLERVSKEEHDYKTLGCDTVGGIVELCAQHICDTMYSGDWSDKGFMGFQRGWDATSEEIKKLLPLLDACVSRGMTVVCVAHTGVMNVKNPVDGDYSKYQPDMNRKVWARLAAWADIIGRADFDYTVLDINRKTNKGRVEGSTTRVLRLTGSAAEDAGCRAGFELPDSLPLAWDAFSEALGRDAVTLPEVEKRWGLFTKQQQGKAMAWLGVSKLSEAPVGRLRQLLNKLKTIESERAAADAGEPPKEA